MSRRHHPLHEAEGEVTAILLPHRLRFACVNAHPHANGDLIPGFVLQILLSLDGGMQGVARLVEGRAKSIADDLEDVSACMLDGPAQNGVMARPRRLPRFGMLAGEPGAVFDVRKEKGDRTGRDGGRAVLLVNTCIMT